MNVIIIAGGTGGHVYPALSIAKKFKNQKNSIIWIGKEDSLESRISSEEKFLFYPINGRGFLGKSFFGKIISLYFFVMAMIRSIFLFSKIQPDIIVSTGGYVSFAPSLIGSLFCPLFIHEQNSIAGLTNKILHRFSRVTFEAFPGTFHKFSNKVICTGNPVRDDISKLADSNKTDQSIFKVLVLGGSQGSKQINDILAKTLEDNKVPANWSFLHQAGKLDKSDLKAAYEKSGVEFEVKDYIEKIDDAYQNCDIIISRSGAMTVSEICSARKPSILLPLPWSSNNHQYINAKYLFERGAAEIIESSISSSKNLFKLLIELENDHNRRESMMNSAANIFPKSAADNIYKIINESLKI